MSSFGLFYFVKLEIWGQAQVTARAILKMRQLLLEYTSVLTCQAAVCKCLSSSSSLSTCSCLSLLKLVSTRTAAKIAPQSSPVNAAGSIRKVRAHLFVSRRSKRATPRSCETRQAAARRRCRVSRRAAQAAGRCAGAGAHSPPTARRREVTARRRA